jgi:hypothetical protein
MDKTIKMHAKWHAVQVDTRIRHTRMIDDDGPKDVYCGRQYFQVLGNAYIHICIFVCMYKYVCMYIYLYVHKYMNIDICIFIDIEVYTCIYIYINMYIDPIDVHYEKE